MISIAFLLVQLFKNIFNGDVFNVGHNGKHPVYRYAKPLWLEYKYDNKNYEVVIKTLGPVHIGSGQVMKKTRLHL